jgi:uncharacterized protein (TIGR03435 family)
VPWSLSFCCLIDVYVRYCRQRLRGVKQNICVTAFVWGLGRCLLISRSETRVTEQIDESQRRAARIAGIAWLISMAAIVASSYGVFFRFIEPTDPAQTAQRILAHETLFRVGIVGILVQCVSLVLLLTALYVVLKPVHSYLALLVAVGRLAHLFTMLVVAVSLFTALHLLTSVQYSSAFRSSEVQALAQLSLSGWGGWDTYYVGLLFWSLATAIGSYLWFMSGYVPRGLAIAGMMSAAWAAACILIFDIVPSFANVMSVWWFDSPLVLFELGLSVWLVFKGLRPAKASTVTVLLLIVATSGTLAAAQDPPAGAGKTFEVASVRPNHSGTTQTNISFAQGGVTFTNLQLRAIIQFAYGINQPSRLAGVPDWANAERFDIVARGTIGSIDDRRAMLQALLADRFKLAAHTEQRSIPIYTLVLAHADGRLGPSLKPSSVDCPAQGRGAGGTAPAAAEAQTAVRCGVRPVGPGEINVIGMPVSALASVLSIMQGRTVVDRTGLKGPYDSQLVFAPDPLPGRGGDLPAVPDGRASIFTAIQEQLGLKLQPGNQPEDVLVVDRISRPDDN